MTTSPPPNPYSPPQAEVADLPAGTSEPGTVPALWNPNAAASWSLVFSPLFGCLVHRQNWLALGDTARAQASTRWAIGMVAWFAAILVAAVVVPENRALDLVFRFGGFGILVGWYYAMGKPQVNLVRARLGDAYRRKGWLKPLGLALLALVGYFAAGVVVTMLAGA